MMYINSTISIITLHVNGLNIPNKKTEIIRVDQKLYVHIETQLYALYKKKPTLNIKTHVD